MARVELSAAASEDLERLIRTHSLPANTKERVKRSLQPLGRFPLLGAALENRWSSFRFVRAGADGGVYVRRDDQWSSEIQTAALLAPALRADASGGAVRTYAVATIVIPPRAFARAP